MFSFVFTGFLSLDQYYKKVIYKNKQFSDFPGTGESIYHKMVMFQIEINTGYGMSVSLSLDKNCSNAFYNGT